MKDIHWAALVLSGLVIFGSAIAIISLSRRGRIALLDFSYRPDMSPKNRCWYKLKNTSGDILYNVKVYNDSGYQIQSYASIAKDAVFTISTSSYVLVFVFADGSKQKVSG